MAGVVVILHLGLGQRGFLHRRPHHGFRALIQTAVHQQLHELLGNHRLGVVIHRQIGLFPFAGHAQPLEFLALDVDPAFGKTAAFLTEGDGVHVVLVQALRPVLFLDLPFDRQAVAIPARHIAAVLAHHLLRTDDEILEDLVERMADVQMPVGIGRAVMQDKRRSAGFLPQAVIDADLFPAGKPVGLAAWQVGAHGKIGLGQKDGVAVIDGRFGRVGAHLGSIWLERAHRRPASFGRGGARGLGACLPATLTRQGAGRLIRRGCVNRVMAAL